MSKSGLINQCGRNQSKSNECDVGFGAVLKIRRENYELIRGRFEKPGIMWDEIGIKMNN
jgi:hypothetical protein